MYAARDIEVGDELFFDYGFPKEKKKNFIERSVINTSAGPKQLVPVKRASVKGLGSSRLAIVKPAREASEIPLDQNAYVIDHESDEDYEEDEESTQPSQPSQPSRATEASQPRRRLLPTRSFQHKARAGPITKAKKQGKDTVIATQETEISSSEIDEEEEQDSEHNTSKERRNPHIPQIPQIRTKRSAAQAKTNKAQGHPKPGPARKSARVSSTSEEGDEEDEDENSTDSQDRDENVIPESDDVDYHSSTSEQLPDNELQEAS